jgi:hypothetical protein
MEKVQTEMKLISVNTRVALRTLNLNATSGRPHSPRRTCKSGFKR